MLPLSASQEWLPMTDQQIQEGAAPARRTAPLAARIGTGAMLAALALGALLMSAVFFLHMRRAGMAQNRLLPGLTLIADGRDLVVTSIESGGQAARRGVAVGDEVVAIDGRAFGSLDQARAYLVRAPHDEVVVELREAGRTRLVRLSRGGD